LIGIRALASGSAGNCYHVTDGKTPLLLECGIRFDGIRRKLNFQMSDIIGCLISHEHNDHSMEFFKLAKYGIDIYMSEGTREALGIPIFHRIKVVKPKEQFKIGTWTILPFDVQHDAAEPLGFLLANRTGEKLLYATDTYYIRYRFNRLSHIMVECNHSYDILDRNVESGVIPMAMKNRLIQSHFSLENVKEFLRANDLSQVEEIWLLHLSDENSDAERFKREIQELTGKPVYIP